MPRYKVTAPDGRTFIVTAPEGATQEQVFAVARNHMPPPKQVPKPAGGTGVMGAVNSFVSAGNEALIGVPESIYNAASAVTDPIIHKISAFVQGEDVADASLKGARQTRRAVVDTASKIVAEPNPIARDIGRIGGALAIPLPGGKLRTGGALARAAYRGMRGAVGGAAVRDVDESAAGPAGIGAAANIVLPPIVSRLVQSGAGRAVGTVVGRYGAPVLRAVDDVADKVMGRYGTVAATARAAASPLAPLGRKAEARAARFASVGVDKPTTGMVTRDPVAFKTERKVAQVERAGDDLADQIQGVERSLVQAGRKLVDRMGGAKGREATGQAGQDVLDAKRTEMQEVTGKLYKMARETRGDDPVGRLDILREKMTDPDIVDNAVFDQMREGISRRMERLGLIGGNGAVSQPVTVRQAEELRKFIGNLGNSVEPGVRMVRRTLIDALDDDVVEAIGDDAFKAARASAKAGFDEFKKTVAGRIADERIPPEDLTKKLLSMPLADLRSVRKSYLTGTPEQVARGRDAWKALQAQGVDDFLKTAISDEGGISGAKLVETFRTRSDHLRGLLDPADYKKLRRLVLASRDATAAPPSSSAYGSDTAPMLANLFQAIRPATRQGWMKFLAKNAPMHTAAFITYGPAANIALGVGQGALSAGAEAKAARALAERIRLARSPEETAAAVRALRDAAKASPVAKKLLDQLGPAIGGGAAATAQ